MGYDIFAVACGLFGLVVGGLGLVVFWIFQAKDRDVLAETWQRYAETHALEFVPPRGEWPNRTLPRVTWTEDDARWSLEAKTSGERLRTRVVVRPHGALLGEMSLDVGPSGERELDEHPPGFAARLVDAEIDRSLLGFLQRDRAELAYQAGNLTLAWSGGELNDARLDHARDVLRRVVARLSAAHGRPRISGSSAPPRRGSAG